MELDVKEMESRQINDALRKTNESCHIVHCHGQRFIGAGMQQKEIVIDGIPGNALGCYLDGAHIDVRGNAQDMLGDTMNDGRIVVHGNAGDSPGYAMRGGEIYIRGNVGYRAGIHMKAYQDKKPIMVIGGTAGSFLGEYQAGGTILVLGLNGNQETIVSNFPATGMHGGRMILRSDCKNLSFPEQVSAHLASEKERDEIADCLKEYCSIFHLDLSAVMDGVFTVITPNDANPYHQMYVAN